MVPEQTHKPQVTVSKPVELKIRADQKFYRTLGRSGVRRIKPRPSSLTMALRLSAMLALSAALWALLIGAAWLFIRYL